MSSNIPLTMDDFDQHQRATPFICDLSPGGKYVAKDYQDAGGSRVLAKRLIERGQLHDNTPPSAARRCTKRQRSPHETPGQPVIRTWDNPLKPTGGLVILKGNLAPEGCVVKVAGHERILHTGTRACVRFGRPVLPRGRSRRDQSERCLRDSL